MIKIILSKNSNKKYVITFDLLKKICLLLYMCAASAHQLGKGFDAVFIRATFVLFVFVSGLDFVVNKKRILINNYVLWLFVFFGYCYLSLWWAADMSHGLIYSNTYIQVFVVAIILINMMETEENIVTLLKLVLCSLVYTAIWLIIKTPIDAFGTERIGVAIGMHSNHLGTYLATGALISLFFITQQKKKLIYVLVLILMTVLALFTGSRKTILMIIFCVSMYVLFYRYKSSDVDMNNKIDKIGNSIFKKIVIVILMGLFLIVVWNLAMKVEIFYNVLGERLESMINEFNGSSNDASIDGRANLRELAKEVFKLHPFLGCGWNNYLVYLKQTGSNFVASCHDNFWELMSTLGIIGTSIFYVPLVLIIQRVILTMRKRGNYPIGLLFSVFIAFNILASPYIIFYCNEFPYLIFVMAYCYYKVNTKHASE